MQFAVLMIAQEPKDHCTDCYFCKVNNVCSFTVKTKHKIVYPSLKLTRRPVPHNDDDLHISVPPENGLQMPDEDAFLERNIAHVEKKRNGCRFLDGKWRRTTAMFSERV